eukprot:SAG22_NODE_1434_length_4427_cov_2.505776_3_plen_380_part_00
MHAIGLAMAAGLVLLHVAATSLSASPAEEGQPEIETVERHSNGTGYFCRGCAALVEAIHDHVDSTRHRWREPGFTVQVPAFVEKHCAAAASRARGDEEQVKRACVDLKPYSAIIAERHYGREPPTAANLYTRTAAVCVDELGMCYPPAAPPKGLGRKKSKVKSFRCAACSTIAADLYDVLTRTASNHPGYLSKAHVGDILGPSECSRLQRRFPQSKALSRMEDVCDELLAESGGGSSGGSGLAKLRELLLLHGAAAARKAGANGEDEYGEEGDGGGDELGLARVQAVLCGELGCKASVLAAGHWPSPFATREPSEAARAANDAGEVNASRFVQELLSFDTDKYDIVDTTAEDVKLGTMKSARKKTKKKTNGKDSDGKEL